MEIIKSLIVWFTGILFVVVFFPLTFILWLLIFPFDRNRVVIHRILLLQSLMIVKMVPLWRTDIQGKEKAARGTCYVIISNHQSMLDILLLNCLGYKYKWVSKVEILKVPVLGWYQRMADYITINRSNEESKVEMIEKSYSLLKRGISIMIFPEGTRSLNRGIGFFKRGAFQLAIQARVPILPVLIDGTGGVLPKHGFVLSSGHRLRIKVLDPVAPESFQTSNPEELAQRFSSMMAAELETLRSTSLL